MRPGKKKKSAPQGAKIVYTRKTPAVESLRPAHFTAASYLKSAPTLKECPEDEGWEVAFAGRSNAGKSSALNSLTSAQLARTSKTPGRTQLINFFSLDEQRRLVDLPGYGYAKVPEAMRREWGQHLGHYVTERQCLRGLILLMDVRHPLTELDWQLVEVAHYRQLPLLLLLTKADKLKRGAAKAQLNEVRQVVDEAGVSAQVQLFSSLKNQGREAVWQQINAWLEWPQAQQGANPDRSSPLSSPDA